MPEAIAAFVVEGLGLTGIAATVTTFVVEVAATAAISQVAGKLLGGGNNDASGQGGTASTQQLNTTIRQAAAPRRLIYGEVKEGGVLVYPAQSADGLYADMAIYLGEGTLAGIEPVFWVGDELSSDSKFTDLLTATFYDGGPGQIASAALIAASGGEWTTDDVGTGCAWVHVRYEFDRNAFPQGLVFPTFLVQGREVYDPRTETTAYSANPALCLLDYIRSEFAYGAPDDWIDFDSFAAAASICDEVLDSIDPLNIVDGVPYKVLRYSLNGVFETSSGPAATVETMERAMGGKLVFSGGKYRAYAGAYRAPTGSVLTAEFLRGDPTFRTHASRQQRINTARGTYREPRQDWQQIDYREQQLAAAVVSEDGEIVQPLNFPATTNGAQAQRLAKMAMLQARSAVPLSLPCNWSAFQWRLYDTVDVSLPELGADNVYLITGYTFAQGGGIDLVLVPHLSADYSWTAGTDETLVPVVIKPNFNSTPAAPVNLFVTGTPVDQGSYLQYTLAATWTATTDAQLKHYEAQYKLSADSEYGNGQTVTSAAAQWLPLQGYEYDVRVRVVRTNDTTSDWSVYTAVLVSNDITAPSVPTSLSVTGTGTHTVNWTTSASSDFSRSQIYFNTVNNSTTATLIDTKFAAPSTADSKVYTPATVPAWYWVASVDDSGNLSARTAAGTAS